MISIHLTGRVMKKPCIPASIAILYCKHIDVAERVIEYIIEQEVEAHPDHGRIRFIPRPHGPVTHSFFEELKLLWEIVTSQRDMRWPKLIICTHHKSRPPGCNIENEVQKVAAVNLAKWVMRLSWLLKDKITIEFLFVDIMGVVQRQELQSNCTLSTIIPK